FQQIAIVLQDGQSHLVEEIAQKILEQEVIEGEELKTLLDRVNSSHVPATPEGAGVEPVGV
ncbi:MAG: hypothetical protein AAGM36_19240, partial [Cyanobacteria bacterium J06597_1]